MPGKSSQRPGARNQRSRLRKDRRLAPVVKERKATKRAIERTAQLELVVQEEVEDPAEAEGPTTIFAVDHFELASSGDLFESTIIVHEHYVRQPGPWSLLPVATCVYVGDIVDDAHWGFGPPRARMSPLRLVA